MKEEASITASPRKSRSTASLVEPKGNPDRSIAEGARSGKRLLVANLGTPDKPIKAVFYQLPDKDGPLQYRGKKHIDEFVQFISVAPPMQVLQTERAGIKIAFLEDLANRMATSFSHLAETIGIPKATAARKLSKGDRIDGASAIALARLLALANEIASESTAPEAESFDAAKWLGRWIETPQPALGGKKPSELLDTPTGVAMVTKVLGAIRSGAYQ